MKDRRGSRTLLIGAKAPRTAVRAAHAVGRAFKRSGGTYYRVHEPYESLGLTFVAWLELHGTLTVVDAFNEKTPLL